MKKTLNIGFFDAGGTLVGADNIFEYIVCEFNNPNINQDILVEEFIREKLSSGKNFLDVKTILKNISERISERYGEKKIGDKVAQIYTHVYTETVYLYPSVLETLQLLQNNDVRLVLVSDADSDVLSPQFTKLGLDGFFEERIISSDVRAYKPSKEIVNYIKKNYDLNKNESIFVGDSIDDVETAKKLGVKSVFIGEKECNADFQMKSFLDFCEFLREYYFFD